MLMVSLLTLKSARRHGLGRAYLARLTPGGRGSIDRLFVKAKKVNDNRQLLETPAHPGDVFEARRWLWDMDRQRYYGGTVWFGVQQSGALCMLTREEAFAAVHAAHIDSDHRSDLPVHVMPARMVPDDIRCEPMPVKPRQLTTGAPPCLP